jgi:hypothetical protein
MPFVSRPARVAYEFRRRILHRHAKLTLTLEDYLVLAERASADKRSIPKTVSKLAQAQLGTSAYVPGETLGAMRELSRQLRSIGTHTNQIAKACNLHAKRHGSPEAAQCLTYLQKLHQQLAAIEQKARKGILPPS